MSKKELTGNKQIHREIDVRVKVLSGVDRIAMPVIETIGPRGKNVLYEDAMGNMSLTNDGVTIAREINVEDPIENAVIEMIKEGSKRTNQEAGDATSTTILYTQVLVHRLFELKKKGLNHRAITDMMNRVADKLLKRLTAQKKEVKTNKTLYEVAKISANNDDEIAKIVAETIETAGLDGMIFLDYSKDADTHLDKQSGFKISSGMSFQNLYTSADRPAALYNNMPVLIFDKQLYHADEAEHILRVAKDAGFDKLCIIAKDFVGDAPNTFIVNHSSGIIKLVLVKVPSDTELGDLAVYLNGHVISEAEGRRVDSLVKADFMYAESVFADPQKVLVKNPKVNSKLTKRIAGIKVELKKDKDNPELKNRLASLTSGIVYIYVGGRTQVEAKEKLFRYEDAISAVRAAKRNGYLVGGGLSILNAFVEKDYSSKDEMETARILSMASIERIAENAQIALEHSKLTSKVGLNALTGKYEDLLLAGIVEPFKAVEMSIKNSVSVACMVTSIGTFILNNHEDTSCGIK